MSDFAHAFTFIGDNAHLLVQKSLDTLALSGAALGIAIVIGLPLGVWLGHTRRASFLVINASNVLRALPSLAVIALGLAFLGIGFTNVMFALVVLAFPVILTNAYAAVEGVDPDVVEAARGMGMKPLEVVTRVEMPLAVPLTFAGIRTAAVYVVATSPLAGFVGGGGLGDIIVNQPQYRLAGVLAAAIVITLLALATEIGLALVQRALTPRALREQAEAPAIGPATREIAA
jgi:osmoprotectant transport system permease protein